jgi:hypothetical protein
MSISPGATRARRAPIVLMNAWRAKLSRTASSLTARFYVASDLRSRFATFMTRKLSAALIVILLLSACGESASRRDQKQYETVEEGSASGVTSTIQGPGETLPPITDTNVDTTNAFTLDPNAVATASLPTTATIPEPLQTTTTEPPPLPENTDTATTTQPPADDTAATSTEEPPPPPPAVRQL